LATAPEPVPAAGEPERVFVAVAVTCAAAELTAEAAPEVTAEVTGAVTAVTAGTAAAGPVSACA